MSGFSRTFHDRRASCLNVSMLTGTPGHLKGFDYLGPYRYFVTFCTESRRRVFVASERVDLVLMQIERSAGEEQFAVLAWDDETTLVVARYILETPVRARLAARVEDYPFAGSRVYSLADILSAASEVIPPRRSG